MTKVKTKTDLLKSNIQKDINKMQRNGKDQAIVRAHSSFCDSSVEKYITAQ